MDAMRGVIGLRTCLLGMLLAVAFGCRAPAPPPPPKPEPTPESLNALYAATDIQVTADEFEQIRPGMSHDEVVEIIGHDETDTKSRYSPGSQDGFTRPRTAIIHRWENPDGSWCELEFVDRVVDVKRHQDLRTANGYAGTKYTLPESRKKK